MRLNLILADTDIMYIENLGKYIRTSWGSRFNVLVFTQRYALEEFLSTKSGKADVVLFSPGIFSDSLRNMTTGIVIVLSDGKSVHNFADLPFINKYQPADNIAAYIFNLYSSLNSRIGYYSPDGVKTKIVSVFSPQGGSGKTMISVGLAAALSKAGYRTLYFNLEALNTSTLFIGEDSGVNSLSNVLLYLKEDKTDLRTKINGVLSYCDRLKINYFMPACCSLELDELTIEELDRLLGEIKQSDRFDIIVIDTDSILNGRILSILKISDYVIMPVVDEELLERKLNVLQGEIKKIMPGYEEEFLKKLTVVHNRGLGLIKDRELNIARVKMDVDLPYFADVFICNGNTNVMNFNGKISAYMEQIAGRIMEELDMVSGEVSKNAW